MGATNTDLFFPLTNFLLFFRDESVSHYTLYNVFTLPMLLLTFVLLFFLDFIKNKTNEKASACHLHSPDPSTSCMATKLL